MWLRCTKSVHLLESLRKSSKSPWLLSSFLSSSDTPRSKMKVAPCTDFMQETRMKDRFKLNVRGGDGGSGCFSVRLVVAMINVADLMVAGNGGRGGDVILECSSAVWDFSGLQHHINAPKGGHGASKNMIGTRGQDKVVQVPVGTVIHLIKGELPLLVENCSTTDLDPWELPGALDIVQSEYPQQCVSKPFSTEEEALLRDGTSSLSDNSVGIVNKESSESKSGEEDVIHLIKDELPSIVENCFTTDLHPWELPGTLDIDQSEAPQQPVSKPFSMEEDSLLRDGTSALDNGEGILNEEASESRSGEEDIEYNVAELIEQGQRIIVACGGESGLGNVSSSNASKKGKLSRHGASRDNAFDPKTANEEQSSFRAGLPGSEAVLVLELKSIADVGLVGMPNAGKSTLLGAVSRAKPTVGHYAFTTLRPNLGKMNFEDFTITVADIPGIIKGAYENRGLGHAFLRHIERTKVLAYVVDLAAALNGGKGLPPWEQLRDLVLELENHQQGVSDRPSLAVENKIDEEGAEGVYEELKGRVRGVQVYPVCAILEDGVPELKAGLRMLMDSGKSQRLRLDEIDCS